MPTNSYDLIVVGDDLAGLCCAALCARRGLRTLVLAREDQPARYTLGPFKLPVEPGVMPGRGTGGAARVVRELGLDHQLKRRARDVRTAVQIVGPDLRIDLAQDVAAQTRELERETPATAAATLAAWEGAAAVAHAADQILDGEDAFPGVGFFERRDVVKQAARAAEVAQAWWASVAAAAAPVAAITRAAAAIGGRAGDPAPIAIARALELWRQGAPPLRGDGTGIRELLLEKLTGANGELKTGNVAELVQGWSKITAVKLASGEELGAGQIVAATPIAHVIDLLGKKPPKELVKLAEAQRRLGWRYTLNLVVDAAAVPEGMAPTVLVLGDDEVADAGATGASHGFAIHAGEADDQGRVLVTVAAFLPATDDEAAGPGPEMAKLAPRTAALRARLLAALDGVMPYFDDHLMLMHSPHEATAPVASGRASYDVGRGFPAVMPSVWSGTLEGAAGLAAAPYPSGVKNLTLASSQVLTGLGVEGDLVCGWNAARVACNVAGKKRDYLKDELVTAS
jgi:phytoene dehydrogenase-like protein